jgi:hypothetical protein
MARPDHGHMNKNTLKFEGVANVGDVIKAFDFEPGLRGRPDQYIVGVVRAKGEVSGWVQSVFSVECVYDSTATKDRTRVGLNVGVPFELTFDYDGRVVKV